MSVIRVSVPATSANCGLGFDTMGLAIGWRGTFTFEPAEKTVITGCPEEYAGDDNLVLQAFRFFCEKQQEAVPDVRIHIDSDIPFARGLGSSATCIAAGLAGANAWFGNKADKDLLLSYASQMEGHPDNAAPAIFGGLCISIMDGQAILTKKIDVCDWNVLAMVPDYPILTAEARKVLPEKISHHQAALQAGRAVLFVQGMEDKQPELVCQVLQDVLHEPYRGKLIPEYKTIKTICLERNIPCWISGSGSTMLACSLNPEKLSDLKYDLEHQFSNITFRLCAMDGKGTEVRYE